MSLPRPPIAAIVSLLLGAFEGLALAQGGDTTPPSILSAASLDGDTIAVCFSEPLSEQSATDSTHYSLDDISFRVVAASLQPDQRSVVLTLSGQIYRTFFVLLVSGVQDVAGNVMSPQTLRGRVREFTAVDINPSQSDSTEPGFSLTCNGFLLETTAGGDGIESTNDNYHFVYTTWPGTFVAYQSVWALEPINRYSQTGFMVREDLAPGSRFFSVVVTPPDVLVKDGSGRGANEYQCFYRDTLNGPVIRCPTSPEIAGVTLPTPNMLIVGAPGMYRVCLPGEHGQDITLAEFTPSVPFKTNLYLGTVTTSHNSGRGFQTKAQFHFGVGLNEYYYLFPPRLQIKRTESTLFLSWPVTEPDIPFFLSRSSTLSGRPSWQRVNEPISVDHQTNTLSIPIGQNFDYFKLEELRRR